MYFTNKKQYILNEIVKPIFYIQYVLTFKLLSMTKGPFADSVDQDLTVQDVQFDFGSTLSAVENFFLKKKKKKQELGFYEVCL